jgi:uncharacterized protein YijF (DUF1287 family)
MIAAEPGGSIVGQAPPKTTKNERTGYLVAGLFVLSAWMSAWFHEADPKTAADDMLRHARPHTAVDAVAESLSNMPARQISLTAPLLLPRDVGALPAGSPGLAVVTETDADIAEARRVVSLARLLYLRSHGALSRPQTRSASLIAPAMPDERGHAAKMSTFAGSLVLPPDLPEAADPPVVSASAETERATPAETRAAAYVPHFLEGTEASEAVTPPTLAPRQRRLLRKHRPPFAGWPSFEPPLVRLRVPPSVSFPPISLPLIAEPNLTLPPAPTGGSPERVCEADRSNTAQPAAHDEGPVRPSDDDAKSASFGGKLVQAAMKQTSNLVIYSVSYTRIPYPRGDVPALYGVCTDVVIRAYRGLGIDLQELVHVSLPGGGDRNIQHRRTEVLRRFFDRHGASLPVTDYPEDYLPGDIVTYHRPNNRTSKSHIAIVTDRIAPSGRPMIVHNRGWGVQVEDALFIDRITGHYRFRGVPQTIGIATAGTASAAQLAPATDPRPIGMPSTGWTAWSSSGPAPGCGRGEISIQPGRRAQLCVPTRLEHSAAASSRDPKAAVRR